MKKGKFAEKAGAAFSRSRLAPESIEDFLGEEIREPVNTVKRKAVNTAEKTGLRRFELKLPEGLAERLHTQAFKESTTKTAIVIDAIAKHLDKLERR